MLRVTLDLIKLNHPQMRKLRSESRIVKISNFCGFPTALWNGAWPRGFGHMDSVKTWLHDHHNWRKCQSDAFGVYSTSYMHFMNMKHSVFLLACFLCLWCIKHEFSQEKVDPGWHPIWASDSLHTVYPSHITRYIPLRRWHIQGWAWQRCSRKEHRLVRREAHHPQYSPAVLTQCGGQDCWCPSPHLAFEDGVLSWIYWVALSKTVDVFVMKCPHKHGFELNMMGECKVWDLE